MRKNFLHPKPGNFTLKNVSTAVLLFYSPTDPHTNPLDIETLQSHMPNKIDVRVVPQFDHIDFIWSMTACKIVYPQILDFVAQHST